MKKILIMGKSGAGKTTLALALQNKILALYLNADRLRERDNDWDFSVEGRLNSARRMKKIAEGANTDYVLADFICPTKEAREIYNADFTIWVDAAESNYEDDQKLFEEPENYDVKVTSNDTDKWIEEILTKLP